MALHNFIRNSHHKDCVFSHWEAMESYEQHCDEQHDEHVPYVPACDRVMEGMRDSITIEMATGTRLPYSIKHVWFFVNTVINEYGYLL